MVSTSVSFDGARRFEVYQWKESKVDNETILAVRNPSNRVGGPYAVVQGTRAVERYHQVFWDGYFFRMLYIEGFF